MLEENARREGKLGQLRDLAAIRGAGDGLVITYQRIEDRFSDLPGTQTLHFNALPGPDASGGVRSLTVIGRPLPSPEALRNMALALTGRVIPFEQPARMTCDVLMADGTGLACQW